MRPLVLVHYYCCCLAQGEAGHDTDVLDTHVCHGVEGVVVVVVGGSVWTSCAVRSSLAGGGCCLGCLLRGIIFFRRYQFFAGFGLNGVEWDLWGGGRGSRLEFRADQERLGPRCSGHSCHSQTASVFEC